MPIEWNENLETGIVEIDNQHRTLFDNINRLMEALSAGMGKEDIGEMIGFLGLHCLSPVEQVGGQRADRDQQALRQLPDTGSGLQHRSPGKQAAFSDQRPGTQQQIRRIQQA